MSTGMLPVKSCIAIIAAWSVLFIHAQDKNGWTNLFDGKTLQGWRTYQNKPATSWMVTDGMMYCRGDKPGKKIHADLLTIEKYENFELTLDWKIGTAANSGVLYLVTENYPSAYQSGPEYQLLDDRGYPGKIEDWQRTGANYAMDPPTTDATKPAGEWNNTKIIVNKGHVEHWLNGTRVVSYDLWTPDWYQHKVNGKWKNEAGYGAATSGHIALQDHGGEVWFRNIKIRKL